MGLEDMSMAQIPFARASGGQKRLNINFRTNTLAQTGWYTFEAMFYQLLACVANKRLIVPNLIMFCRRIIPTFYENLSKPWLNRPTSLLPKGSVQVA
jgi:hypothetical protein